MSTARVIYHLARADFLERVRRYSFLVMLGLVVFLGYQTAVGNLTVRLDIYRGVFNSAWVGSMMSLIATFFLGWFGFYLIKGSVARDRETGVGQIMATTPLNRVLYLIGKWASNFAVLVAMVAVLAVAGIGIQFLAGENYQLDLVAMFLPYLLVTLPFLAVVAAVAVLFESIGFLSGGLGNMVYFFLFITIFPFIESMNNIHSAFEPLGLGMFQQSMSEAAVQTFPEYEGGFVIGSPDIGVDLEPALQTFQWNGIHWTPDIVLVRLSFIVIAFGLILFAALFFDRFDPSRSKPMRRKNSASSSTPEPVSTSQTVPAVQLTPLNKTANRFSFFNTLTAELKLMLKGQRWWWYAIAVGFIIAGFSGDSQTVREMILPFTWIWHILLISPIGNREARDNVQQLAFSSASPLWRQLPAQWLAGFIVTLLIGSGAALNFIINGDAVGLLALLSGAIFIPSLALALGVWSGTSKVFEIVYMSLWYIGPLNRVPEVDFIGASGSGRPEFFIPLSIALIAFAFFGRSRQLRD
jgi:hypothetical protein